MEFWEKVGILRLTLEFWEMSCNLMLKFWEKNRNSEKNRRATHIFVLNVDFKSEFPEKSRNFEHNVGISRKKLEFPENFVESHIFMF